MPITGLLIGCALMMHAAAATGETAGQAGVDYDTFSVSRLSCVIGNNKSLGEHRAWYNGVYSINSPDQSKTPFVPLYAGLNLENFFDARPRHSDNAIFFEPRSAPMEFRKIDDKTAELYQPATPYFGIESWTRFELKEPYYIDFSFRCIPHKNDLKGNFFGVFWASYINGPLNKSTYFLSGGSTLDKPRWVQYCTQKHDRDSTVPHDSDKHELKFDEGPTVLWNQISLLRYSEPFFCGQFENMALIYIFEPNPIIRFSHSPSGGGDTPAKDDTNPAWDFQMVIQNYTPGAEYSFKGRFVYKPWVDRADVLNEVRQYLAGI